MQELGACSEATPEVRVSDFWLGAVEYKLYLCSAPETRLSQAILIQSCLEFYAERKVGLPVGLFLQGEHGNSRIHFACLHLPDSKWVSTEARPRSGAEEVWT